ncbi:MAG: cytochrome c [Thermoleophilia bacterium]
MKRWNQLAAVAAAVAMIGGVAAGCGGSSKSEASTPNGSPTVGNTAVQTDSKGNTSTSAIQTPTGGGGSTAAPATTSSTPATSAASTAKAPAAGAGDAAAGKTFFTSGPCQGCHPNGGTQAGAGPQLQGAGLTADRIKTQVQNGGGAMPGGLASGKDLDNVVAYVLSIQ